MINQKIAIFLINECLKNADFAELYIEKSITNVIIFDNGKVKSIDLNLINGIGIRLIKQNKSIYGYTNEINKNKILKLIEKLKLFFKKNRKIYNCKKFINKEVKKISKIKNSFFSFPIDKKIKILENAYKIIKNKSSMIKNATCIFIGNKKNIEIYNSNGLHLKDKTERIRLILKAIASKNDVYETMFESHGTQSGMDFFLKNINIEKIAENVANDAINLLNAKKCPAGKMTVIIGNGFGGVLFHESCGHALEASSVAYNLSIFNKKQINKKIASNLITAYDDAIIPNAWGSNNIDDEGNKTNKICLIKNGILNNFLIDNFNGRKMNKIGNGTCRRENYKFEPTSRMSNTFIDNGNSTVNEIIKKTKFGLYAKKMGGGSVNTITGEFEFAVIIGYMIRNGKIAEQVKGATLIGKCSEILKNIDMVGNDLKRSQGYCGASSGYIPVEVGQPTIRIKKMLVGGSNKK